MRKRSLRGKIRSIVRQHKKIDYWYSCYRKRNNSIVQDFVRDKSYTTVTIETIGENHCKATPKQIAYYIRSGNSFSGFCAEFRRTLDALFFADYYGFIPVIEYNQEYIYAESVPVNGTNNPFEYYFQQPGSITVQEINNYRFVSFKDEHRDLAKALYHLPNAYELSEDYIREMGNTIKKYIKLNSDVENFINESIAQIGLNNRCIIGVHYRGTDYHVGYKDHPNIVTLEDYFESLDSLFQEVPENAVIFLATDEDKAIESFTRRYNKKVLFFDDTFRSKSGAPVHFSDNKRQFHKYTLGLEILRDVIALSKCNYLVAGLSQVSYCARYFKYSKNEKYIKKIILNTGVK